MKLINYPYKKNVENNWDKVFQNPLNIQLKSFKTGTVKINRKGTLNPELIDLKEEELEVPILAHWVHHDEKGDFLLDIGLDASYLMDSHGGLEGSSVDNFKLGENENIGYYLEENDIKLKMIFLSHLHADHAAGCRDIPKNIPIVVGKGEYDDYQPDIHGNFLEGLDELYEIDFTHASDMPYLEKCVDLLGDGSLWAIHTPGHTPGHISFLVNGLDGPILLTMDAAFIRENLERKVAPSDFTWNVEKAQESLEKLIRFLDAYPQVRVGPGHELLK